MEPTGIEPVPPKPSDRRNSRTPRRTTSFYRVAIPGQGLDGSALRKRFVADRDLAKLPPLRFHDLRHALGSLAVDGGATLVQVQAWLGHADLATNARYPHTARRTTDAELLGRAFAAKTAHEQPAAVRPSR